MTLRATLVALAQAIADEAEMNPAFQARLARAFGDAAAAPPATTSPRKRAARAEPAGDAVAARKGGRRAPAVLDPIDLARRGEAPLREQLSRLDLEALKDIVADHAMDPSRKVMRWARADRIIDHIVEMALERAVKGEAFRSG